MFPQYRYQWLRNSSERERKSTYNPPTFSVIPAEASLLHLPVKRASFSYITKHPHSREEQLTFSSNREHLSPHKGPPAGSRHTSNDQLHCLSCWGFTPKPRASTRQRFASVERPFQQLLKRLTLTQDLSAADQARVTEKLQTQPPPPPPALSASPLNPEALDSLFSTQGSLGKNPNPGHAVSRECARAARQRPSATATAPPRPRSTQTQSTFAPVPMATGRSARSSDPAMRAARHRRAGKTKAAEGRRPGPPPPPSER